MVAFFQRAVSDFCYDCKFGSSGKGKHILDSGIERIGSVPDGKSDRVVFTIVKLEVVVVHGQDGGADCMYANRIVCFGSANRHPFYDVVRICRDVYARQTELSAFKFFSEFSYENAFGQSNLAFVDYDSRGDFSAIPFRSAFYGCFHGIFAGVNRGGFGKRSVVFAFVSNGDFTVALTIDLRGINDKRQPVIGFFLN